jgi:hypothetical protein
VTNNQEYTRLLAVAASAALVSAITFIGSAVGADNPLVKAPLTACPSDKTVIGGVNACGKIWKITSGEATLGALCRNYRLPGTTPSSNRFDRLGSKRPGGQSGCEGL